MAKYSVVLPDKIKAQVAILPESGMGYHTVDLKLKDGTTRYNRTILNGEELVLLCNAENIHGSDIKEVIQR